MRSFLKIGGFIAISAIATGCDDDIEKFSLTLKGEQEVPPVTSTNSARAKIKLPELNGQTTLIIDLKTTGFEATGVHVHEAFAGKNGAVVFALVQRDGNSWKLNTTLTDDQLKQLRAGAYYLNAHSSANPSGELRAQITPDGINVKHFPLEGSQEVPAVVTPHTGFAAATYNYSNGSIIVNATEDLDDATAAHIHLAPTGSNGSVIIGLAADGPNGWTTPDNSTLDAAGLAAYEAGELYVNVHSGTVGSGELRGQFPEN